jgi:hypothetical protein
MGHVPILAKYLRRATSIDQDCRAEKKSKNSRVAADHTSTTHVKNLIISSGQSSQPSQAFHQAKIHCMTKEIGLLS